NSHQTKRPPMPLRQRSGPTHHLMSLSSPQPRVITFDGSSGLSLSACPARFLTATLLLSAKAFVTRIATTSAYSLNITSQGCAKTEELERSLTGRRIWRPGYYGTCRCTTIYKRPMHARL